MSDLLKRMRAAREEWVSAGPHAFCLRRPTDLQLSALREKGGVEVLRRSLVGWRDVRECDLLPNASDKAAEFDLEVAVEWLEDRMDLMAALMEGLRDMISRRAAADEGREKN